MGLLTVAPVYDYPVGRSMIGFVLILVCFPGHLGGRSRVQGSSGMRLLLKASIHGPMSSAATSRDSHGSKLAGAMYFGASVSWGSDLNRAGDDESIIGPFPR